MYPSALAWTNIALLYTEENQSFQVIEKIVIDYNFSSFIDFLLLIWLLSPSGFVQPRRWRTHVFITCVWSGVIWLARSADLGSQYGVITPIWSVPDPNINISRTWAKTIGELTRPHNFAENKHLLAPDGDLLWSEKKQADICSSKYETKLLFCPGGTGYGLVTGTGRFSLEPFGAGIQVGSESPRLDRLQNWDNNTTLFLRSVTTLYMLACVKPSPLATR